MFSAGSQDAAAAAANADDEEYDGVYGSDDADDDDADDDATDDADGGGGGDYNPYVTIGRNMQQADVGFSAVAWLHRVCTSLVIIHGGKTAFRKTQLTAFYWVLGFFG